MRTALTAALTTALALILSAAAALGDGEPAGEFDYYVMSLSWSPTFCALEGDARGEDQCDARHEHTFTLHGLWPQYDRGWPSYCRTDARDPSRRQSAAMADIMGSGGLAWYEWKKHGRCSGLSAEDYYATSRQAYESIVIPDIFLKIRNDLKVDPSVIEAAFLEANPALKPDMITITCKANRIQEARICLTRDLAPRACGADVARDCTFSGVLLGGVR